MPWKEATAMSERSEFIQRTQDGDSNISALCHEYGISRTTGYKWLKRYTETGIEGLRDRSRQPHRSPNQTLPEVEETILQVRAKHPSWGGVKINAYLARQGWQGLPAASTVTAILQRHDLIDPQESIKHRPLQRFERSTPNELWQMDFKGYFRIDQGTCHPLPFPLSGGLTGLSESNLENRANPFDSYFSSIWIAGLHVDGQWLTLGRRPADAPYYFDCLVDAAGHCDYAWPPLPSPNPRQRRASASHSQSGIARPCPITRSARLSGSFRPMAEILQPGTTSSITKAKCSG